jgi:adenosylhomocysteine nucleosidase
MRTLKSSAAICLCILLSLCSVSAQDKPAQITAILGAFGEEVSLIETMLAEGREQKVQGISFWTGKLNGRQVVLARSGVGKVNAAMTAALLIAYFKPSEVIFTGIAGAINPDLLPADIVIAARTAQHDFGALTVEGFIHRGAPSPVNGNRNPVFFPADAALLAAAEKAASRVELEKVKTGQAERSPKVMKGVIVTGDAFISSPSKKLELRKTLGADAVEMEGAAVAQVCFQQSTPCLVIRSMSDLADQNAQRDYEKFYRIAARNSAKLVAAIVEQLSAKTTSQ